MIRAAKNALGEWLVWRLIHSAVTKHFSAVHVRVREPEHEGPEDHAGPRNDHHHSWPTPHGRAHMDQPSLPTIYYVNHSNWWDGYLCMVLARTAARCNPYLMMEDKNLARYRFFTWAGVFGVDRDDPRAALASLDYAATLLMKPNPRQAPVGMFIFPQGTITPNDRRPLLLFSGAARLALKVAARQPVRLVPVAFRYDFLQEQRPEAFISLGPGMVLGAALGEQTRQGGHGGPPLPTPRELNAGMTLALTAELDALRDAVIAERFADFTTVLRGKQGIDRAFDRLSSRGRRVSRRLSQTS